MVCSAPKHKGQCNRFSLQFVVRGAEGLNGGGEVAAVQFRFNAYGAKQNPDGSWQSKYGTLYATDMADARCAGFCHACLERSTLRCNPAVPRYLRARTHALHQQDTSAV